MKKYGKKLLSAGIGFVVLFILWTILIITVDVKPIGINNTEVGFSTLNSFFHSFTGTNMVLYTITDWLGLVPIAVCFAFVFVGFMQLVKRKNLFKVDRDIILLGIYYVAVVFCYLAFEMIPINYRPILIDGFMEASYPSSTTLLVLSVMPTLNFQTKRRLKNTGIKNTINVITTIFSLFMVIGRLVSGVHWLTDIIGSILLSEGLFLIYKSLVILKSNPED